MRKLAIHCVLLTVVAAFAASMHAETITQTDKPGSHANATESPAHFYRLSCVLEELGPEGKPANSRSFSIMVGTAGTRLGQFVVGSKIPLISGTASTKDDPNKPSTQFQYIDVGIKVQANDVHENGNGLAFNLRAEVSSLGEPKMLNDVSEPVIRENTWNGDVLVPVGKTETVFESDSLGSKGSMKLEVTATRVE